MKSIVMPILMVAAAASGQLPNDGCSCYLYEPAYHLDNVLRGQPHVHQLQPGDIMLYTDKNWFWAITHDLACAFEPHGSGVVFQRPDGSLAILEAGPNDTMHVGTLDAIPHLKEYESRGPVWIRRRKCPLTPEESARLTEFALRQDGKWFALIRLGGQLTPFRTRGPIRTYFWGHAHGDRDSYFCSELVTESLVYSGLVDRETARPCCTYPHDLFYDWSFNLYLNTHFTLAHGWDPPARWSSHIYPARP
jgi:hypothetical protein